MKVDLTREMTLQAIFFAKRMLILYVLAKMDITSKMGGGRLVQGIHTTY